LSNSLTVRNATIRSSAKFDQIIDPDSVRWWPPFCLVVDWVAATVIAVEIVAGVHFHH
jgi:hypothetical protein